ncbi:unnamed protein product [Choristocarpus tenellus]
MKVNRLKLPVKVGRKQEDEATYADQSRAAVVDNNMLVEEVTVEEASRPLAGERTEDNVGWVESYKVESGSALERCKDRKLAKGDCNFGGDEVNFPSKRPRKEDARAVIVKDEVGGDSLHPHDMTANDPEDFPASTTEESSNPFALFAFGGCTTATKSKVTVGRSPSVGSGDDAGNNHLDHPTSKYTLHSVLGGGEYSSGPFKRKAGTVNVSMLYKSWAGRAKKSKPDRSEGKVATGKALCSRAEDFDNLSEVERLGVVNKWRAMADGKEIELVQRFQVLVSVILSSRAQAVVVAEALSRLKKREGGLTVEAMATIKQEELADIIRSVHWNKAKAKHIHEAALTLKQRHQGKVPSKEKQLLALPGVGPALGRILAVVYASWDSLHKSEMKEGSMCSEGDGYKDKLESNQSNKEGDEGGVTVVQQGSGVCEVVDRGKDMEDLGTESGGDGYEIKLESNQGTSDLSGVGAEDRKCGGGVGSSEDAKGGIAGWMGGMVTPCRADQL